MGPNEVLSAGGSVASTRAGGWRDRHRRRRAQAHAHGGGRRGGDGRALGELPSRATRTGTGLLDFAREQGEERIWAIEDCRHVSGALERFLLGAGETVIRVPPSMMAGARKSDARAARATRSTRWRSPGRRSASPICRARSWPGPSARSPCCSTTAPTSSTSARGRRKRLRWLLHDLDPVLEPAARDAQSVRHDPTRRPALGAPRATIADPDLPRAPSRGCATSPAHRRDQGRARAARQRLRRSCSIGRLATGGENRCRGKWPGSIALPAWPAALRTTPSGRSGGRRSGPVLGAGHGQEGRQRGVASCACRRGPGPWRSIEIDHAARRFQAST